MDNKRREEMGARWEPWNGGDVLFVVVAVVFVVLLVAVCVVGAIVTQGQYS